MHATISAPAAYHLIATSGRWGETETVLWTGPAAPGINQCARLLTAAGADGFILCPDGQQVRRYRDAVDKYES